MLFGDGPRVKLYELFWFEWVYQVDRVTNVWG